MSKLTIGVLAGAALASAAVLSPLVAAGDTSAHDITLNAAATARPTGAATGRVQAAVTTTTTTRSTTTTTSTSKPKAAVVVLIVPAPTSATPNPDPRSAACIKAPATPYCTVNSVRYLFKGSPAGAHTKWLPVLTKWGLTNVDDGCTDPTNTSSFCVLRGTHGAQSVTVLFKTVFDGPYAPKNVDAQTTAIRTKALADANKATTAVAKAKIMQAATKKIETLEATADAWNAKHPTSTVNVAVSQ